MDGNGNATVKGELVPGQVREMNKTTKDNDPAFTAVGDRQYHHFTVEIPAGTKRAEIVLKGYEGMDNFDLTLLADKDAFQLRLHMKSADQDLVYEFYYLTSRKSYIRISGDGGETFTGGMYVLTSRVNKIISDAEKVLSGIPVDPTAKN
jgi:hypothetical protein